MWNTNYGFNAVYYFKNPEFETSSRLNGIYKFSKKGSVSEINASNKYEFTSKTFGLTVGLFGNVGDKYILYFDIGLGYSIIDNNGIYSGNLSQSASFKPIGNELIIKNNEIIFLSYSFNYLLLYPYKLRVLPKSFLKLGYQK